MDQAVINGLAEGSVYALLALGLIFINRITQVATFAHGEVATFAAFVGYTVFAKTGAPLLIAVVCSIIAGGALGYAIEWIVIRRVQGSGLLATIIVTLGLYFVLHSSIVAIWGPEVRTYPAIFGDNTLHFGGVAVSSQNLGVIAAALAIALALAAYLRWTPTGLALRAIPQNRYGAKVIGLNLRRLNAITWIIGSAVGAMAGVLIAPLTFLNSNMMASPLIKAFAVAALGGLDSLVGAFVGGLLLGVTENVLVVFIPTYLKDSIAFFFVFIVLLVQPKGLFRKQTMEKV